MRSEGRSASRVAALPGGLACARRHVLVYRKARTVIVPCPPDAMMNCNNFQFCCNDISRGMRNGRIRVPASLGAASPPRWPRLRSATGLVYRGTRTASALELLRGAHGNSFLTAGYDNKFAITFNLLQHQKTSSVKQGRVRVQGALRSSVNSFARVRQLSLLRDANGIRFRVTARRTRH